MFKIEYAKRMLLPIQECSNTSLHVGDSRTRLGQNQLKCFIVVEKTSNTELKSYYRRTPFMWNFGVRSSKEQVASHVSESDVRQYWK